MFSNVNSYLSKNLKQSKNFFSFSLLRALGEGLFYILPLLLAKFLTQEDFASFSLIQMVVMILITVLLTSAQTPIVVYANKELAKSGSVNRTFTIQLLFLFISVVTGVGALLVFKSYFLSFTHIEDILFSSVFFFYISLNLKIFFENLFLSLNRRNMNALYAILVGVLSVLLLLIYNYYNQLDLGAVFQIYFISSVAVSLISTLLLLKEKLFPLEFDGKILKEVFKWSSWQIFGLLSVQLINWGDNIVLRYFVDLEQIAVYNLAYQVFKGLVGATFIISTYFLPYLTQNVDNIQKLKSYLYVKRVKIIILAVLLILFTIAITPLVLPKIYGPDYQGAVPILMVLLIALMFHTYSVFYVPLFNVTNRYTFLQIFNVLQVILNLGLDVILISKLGIIGGAYATLFSYSVRALANEVYFRKNFPEIRKT